MSRSVYLCVLALAASSILQAEPVADPGSRGVNWSEVKSRVAQHDWAAGTVRDMERDVDAISGRYEHPPLGTTGWFHEYFCDDDAQRLVFDAKKPECACVSGLRAGLQRIAL